MIKVFQDNKFQNFKLSKFFKNNSFFSMHAADKCFQINNYAAKLSEFFVNFENCN